MSKNTQVEVEGKVLPSDIHFLVNSLLISLHEWFMARVLKLAIKIAA
ncbi:unnamed protein product (macronuclear) [Paramecium tetraurelia]|uniref:Uncharacterized protein n=1 Tax=Paramecium tetraurelia TaxID=5888 RepID=A0C5X2_PARTE|nr:uncharacterized protein GSPATT00035318001 [Paramecium tetraurelia]CAK66189.1 unnamed protein product [Paramecium tetraurelia]|eukprot:XP_001433586.1 hypothetical protein (macronuclear) [Paramecium tetraurelia strain d4-2]